MGGSGASLSRRGFLGASFSAALGATGAYAVIENLARKPLRPGPDEVDARLMAWHSSRSSSASLPPEQYLFDRTETVTDNGVVVTVPPLHHEIVTAKLVTANTAAALQSAQRRLEAVLQELENDKLLTYTPAGLGLAVGWGLSYFEHRLPASLTAEKMPRDLTAPKVKGAHPFALLPAVRFSTDPAGVILEDNDVVVVMASDSADNISSAYDAIFKGGLADLFSVTSIRQGFVDATKLASESGQSLTKQVAMKYKLPSAASIPDRAELFLGFTSTQVAALGPGVIANLESLRGFTDQWPNGYFRYGTTLALSHLYEDLENWYNGDFSARVSAAFTPRAASSTRKGTTTLPEGPAEVETKAEILTDASYYGTVGHSSSMQPVSRLKQATTDNYGHSYPKDTTIPVRADFNTIDSPFAYSSDPKRDGWRSTPHAGVHFVSYVPTSYYFEQLRRAMDGEYAGGTSVGPAVTSNLFMTSIQATHRQNFLVPPGRIARSPSPSSYERCQFPSRARRSRRNGSFRGDRGGDGTGARIGGFRDRARCEAARSRRVARVRALPAREGDAARRHRLRICPRILQPGAGMPAPRQQCRRGLGPRAHRYLRRGEVARHVRDERARDPADDKGPPPPSCRVRRRPRRQRRLGCRHRAVPRWRRLQRRQGGALVVDRRPQDGIARPAGPGDRDRPRHGGDRFLARALRR